MRAREVLLVVVMVVLSAGVAVAGEIRMELRVEPLLDLDGTERVFVGPIMLEPSGGEPTHSVDLVAAREFSDHVKMLIKRRTRLNLVGEDLDLQPPAESLSELLDDPQFWIDIGTETGAEYVVAASLDVEVLDREGYTTEKYVSPQDGKTYFRQVLVEETGFDYDILLAVVDADTGEVVHQDLVSDFKERSKRKLSAYQDMFDDLYHLENRLLGIFVPRTVQAKRFLYRD
jgi:hypothetical protein